MQSAQLRSTQSHFFRLFVAAGEYDCGEGDAASGDGDGGAGDGGDDGGGGEATRLISAVEFSPVSPSIPRKISGAASSSSAADGDGDAAGLSAADLFLASKAARWLTLDAAKATFATFLG